MAGIRERYHWRRKLALAGAASYEFSEVGRYNRQSFFEGGRNLAVSLSCLNWGNCLGFLNFPSETGIASEIDHRTFVPNRSEADEE